MIITLGLNTVVGDYDFDDFIVQVGEVREPEEIRCCSPVALSCMF